VRAPLAVVCVSGGMDSAVAAAIAAETQELALLHGQYGQRTEAKELECFSKLAEHFGARHRRVVDLKALRGLGGSSLTDPSMPVHEGPSAQGSIPSSYVPFRNAHLLSAATSWGEILGARAIYVGAVWEDSSGYPDCRPEFYQAFQTAISLGTRPETHLLIETPLIHLTKAEIVRRGRRLGVPFASTWSCYQSEDRSCGVCESCLLRLKGFAEAGLEDPIPYGSRVKA